MCVSVLGYVYACVCQCVDGKVKVYVLRACVLGIQAGMATSKLSIVQFAVCCVHMRKLWYIRYGLVCKLLLKV